MLKKRFLILIILIISQALTARGSLDLKGEYSIALEDTFNRVLTEVEAGDITSTEGKMQLSLVREKYRQPYNDEFGILESLIDQVGESSLSIFEAQLHFTLLQKDKLMEYRREKEKDGNQNDSSGIKNNEDTSNPDGDNDSGNGDNKQDQGDEQRKGNS